MANRLSEEKSPYLLQHAHQPVDWMPWGDAAFQLARSLDKPVFLSAGYSTCHWCHVMAHESFDDPAVAAVLNEHFVNIKLDREERPDVDRLYMTYVQATTGHGGWPMSVWLTPELKPFYGGTYFPPRGMPGRPGFLDVLRAIIAAWQTDRVRLTNQADAVVAALAEHTAGGSSQNTAIEDPVAADVLRALGQFEEHFDGENGGFGGAPKFPRPVSLACVSRALARLAPDSPDRTTAAGMLRHTLSAMVRGGIHDHVGGGFHRYTVDERWHVPHFEKMLYDQGQIAVALADGLQQLGEKSLEAPLRALAAYVARDLTEVRGGCFCAEDADSVLPAGRQPSPAHPGKDHGEGAFYVWTEGELRAALGKEYPLIAYAFRCQPDGNVDPMNDPHGEFRGVNILERVRDDAEVASKLGGTAAEVSVRIAAALEKLRLDRAGRPRPHLDDKIVAAWNGLMISGLARASQALADPKLAEQASRIAGFIREELWDSGRRVLHRTWRGGRSSQPGFAEDYAFVCQGLLDLYETTFDVSHLEWALELQELMCERFEDKANGGFFSSEGDAKDLFLRLKEDYDGAEPAPSSVAALNLARLSSMLERPDLRASALGTVRAFAHRWREAPVTMPAMVVAADFLAGPVSQVVISGDPSFPATRDLIAAVQSVAPVRRVVLLDDRGAGRERLLRLVPRLAEFPIEGPAAVHVCRDFTCALPETDAVRLLQSLRGLS